MNINRLLLACVLANVLGISYAQNWDNYQPIQSKGLIPKQFTESYIAKYQYGKEQISEDETRKTRKRQDDFYRKSEYSLNNFFTSGDVLFGDTITQYCETILDLLLEDYPDLREELSIFLVRSPAVNAAATANGVIFVNLGLLAQVENEAQLAFVLAHEVVHYQKNHVVDQYVEQERIRRGEDLYKKIDYDGKLNSLSKYSKNHELEADSEGFNQFFKSSGYSQEESQYLMDVLLYSYLPFDLIPFDPSVIEPKNYKIPEEYFLEEIAPITAVEEFEEEHATHPNIKLRKEELDLLINNEAESKLYLVSENWFKHCQRIARYETSRSFLSRSNFPAAIYNAFLLGKTYGTDHYQKMTIAKALHKSSAFLNDRKLHKRIPYWKKIEGESQEIHHLFSKFTKEELNTIAVAYAYELYLESGDENAKEIFEWSLFNLVYDLEMFPSSFAKRLPSDTTKPEVTEEVTSERRGKVSKIKKAKNSGARAYKPYQYAFADFFKDTLFTNTFEKYVDYKNEHSDKENSRLNSRDKYDENEALGIDKILCISPEYLRLDDRISEGVKFIKSSKKQADYRQTLLDMADATDLELELLDHKTLQETDIDKLNDLNLLENWIDERVSQENTGALSSDFDYEYLERIREKYNTDYVAVTGNLTLRISEDISFLHVYYGLIIWPSIPFILADLLTPDYSSYNYFFLFDLKNGKVLLAEYYDYDTKDGADYVNSIVYNNLLQVKSKAN